MKCKVCNKRFKPLAENRYEVARLAPDGLLGICSKPQTVECFDCPRCGCQNVVNVREVSANVSK